MYVLNEDQLSRVSIQEEAVLDEAIGRFIKANWSGFSVTHTAFMLGFNETIRPFVEQCGFVGMYNPMTKAVGELSRTVAEPLLQKMDFSSEQEKAQHHLACFGLQEVLFEATTDKNFDHVKVVNALCDQFEHAEAFSPLTPKKGAFVPFDGICLAQGAPYANLGHRLSFEVLSANAERTHRSLAWCFFSVLLGYKTRYYETRQCNRLMALLSHYQEHPAQLDLTNFPAIITLSHPLSTEKLPHQAQ